MSAASNNRLIGKGKAHKGAVTAGMCMLAIPADVFTFDERLTEFLLNI